MEPPHVKLGGEEECHSNESGWTMYIGSPRDEEAHCGDDDEEINGGDHSLDYDYEAAAAQADPDVESDDSMASDASSGPSHYGAINPLGSSGYDDGFTHFQHQTKEHQVKDKYCSNHHKRTTTTTTTTRASSKSKGNQVVVEKNNEMALAFTNSKGKAPAVQNSGKAKVNKNYRVGTRTRKS